MRRTSRCVALGGLLASSLASAGEPAAPAPYGAPARIAHIASALTALSEASPAELQQGIDFARALERGACSAGAERLRVECLMVAMRRYCHDRAGAEAQRCPLTMDIVVSNVLADAQLIPPEKRYQIVRENKDYRPALAREIHRIQGTLAVDFRLHAGGAGVAEAPAVMAANIDRYCLSSADENQLSYQTCVSSLVWFIKGPK